MVQGQIAKAKLAPPKGKYDLNKHFKNRALKEYDWIALFICEIPTIYLMLYCLVHVNNANLKLYFFLVLTFG